MNDEQNLEKAAKDFPKAHRKAQALCEVIAGLLSTGGDNLSAGIKNMRHDTRLRKIEKERSRRILAEMVESQRFPLYKAWIQSVISVAPTPYQMAKGCPAHQDWMEKRYAGVAKKIPEKIQALLAENKSLKEATAAVEQRLAQVTVLLAGLPSGKERRRVGMSAPVSELALSRSEFGEPFDV